MFMVSALQIQRLSPRLQLSGPLAGARGLESHVALHAGQALKTTLTHGACDGGDAQLNACGASHCSVATSLSLVDSDYCCQLGSD